MKRYVLGISGCSGSGKSEILKKLSDKINSNLISIISQDNYYKKRDSQLIDLNGFHNFDLPESIDEKKFYDDIFKLISGKNIEYFEYNYNNPKLKSNKKEIISNPIIIVEGLFVFHYKKINNLFNSRVFIDAELNLMIKRRLNRDLHERGYDKNDVEYRYKNHVIPAFKKFTKPYKNASNLIINNNKSIELSVTKLSNFLLNDFNKYKRRLS